MSIAIEKSGGINLTDGEKNFIESKDNLHYNVTTNCLLHGTLIVFCVAEILLYFFEYEYDFIKGSLFGFSLAIVIASLDIINVLVRLCLQKKYQHAYYGVCLVLISLYLHYFAIKVGLYPFNQLFGFMAIVLWIICSVSFMYAIIDNIRRSLIEIMVIINVVALLLLKTFFGTHIAIRDGNQFTKCSYSNCYRICELYCI